jgi:hypothetical protein
MNCVAGYGNLSGGDSVVCRIASGWLPPATAYRSQPAMIPETKSSHRSNTAPAVKTQPTITYRNTEA